MEGENKWEEIRPEVKVKERKRSKKIDWRKNYQKRKNYFKKYKQKSEVKKKEKERSQRPEVKKKRRLYRQKPEVIARIKAYNQLPEVKTKRNIKQKLYRQKPQVKKRLREWQVGYRKNNLETFKLYQQKWVNKNGGEKFINKLIRTYNKKPDVKIRINKRRKEKLKNNNYFRLICGLRNHFYTTMKIYSKTGKIMKSKLYGIDYKAGLKHLGNKPDDGNDYHIDHIIPISWFDHNNPLEIKWCWSPDNLQWLRADINLWKKDRFILALTIEEQKNYIIN